MYTASRLRGRLKRRWALSKRPCLVPILLTHRLLIEDDGPSAGGPPTKKEKEKA
jgi:hypothetical protein